MNEPCGKQGEKCGNDGAQRAVADGGAEFQPEVHGNKRVRKDKSNRRRAAYQRAGLSARQMTGKFIDGGAVKVVLRKLKAQIFILYDAQKHPADGENEPHKKSDKALQCRAADEESGDRRSHIQSRADPACDSRIVAVHRKQARKRFFPLFLALFGALFRGDPFAAQQFITGHAVQFRKRGQHGDIGAGGTRLPAGYRLIGYPKPICGFLLRHSFGFT